MTPFTPLLVTSLYEVFIERMEHNDTLHTSACDLTVCMKYLLREWSIMTPFTPLLVTSLYEVFIERMEHNDTLHTSTCDLIV